MRKASKLLQPSWTYREREKDHLVVWLISWLKMELIHTKEGTLTTVDLPSLSICDNVATLPLSSNNWELHFVSTRVSLEVPFDHVELVGSFAAIWSAFLTIRRKTIWNFSFRPSIGWVIFHRLDLDLNRKWRRCWIYGNKAILSYPSYMEVWPLWWPPKPPAYLRRRKSWGKGYFSQCLCRIFPKLNWKCISEKQWDGAGRIGQRTRQHSIPESCQTNQFFIWIA